MPITIPQGVQAKLQSSVDYERRASVEHLMSLAVKIAANQTPGLLERWAQGMGDGGVLCPFGCSWGEWVLRVRGGELEKLPWER